MPIHIAITRRVRPGRETEFEGALREFFQASFAHPGVKGASMLVPPPGSGSREFGILRTFQDERELEDFYRSPLFIAWDERARELTEDKPQHRRLHGLEAWFRSSGNPPPKWKMALITFAGVYVYTLLLTKVLGPLIRPWPLPVSNAVFNVIVVAGLTWVIMPFLTRLLRSWLNPPQPEKASTL
jgi:antibiotic biosynthesis monooxygenase (ABM) superfamily enzyme